MKHQRKRRLLSAFLAALFLIPSFPITAAEEFPVFREGETVYAPTLTGTGRGVPDGWLAAPETQVPWPNGGASNGWVTFNASNTKNKEINPAGFTYTDKGLAVNIGNGDFSVLFPALMKDGLPVTDFVYSITVSGLGSTAGGSFGLITDAAGGEDYKGGSYLMVYSAGSGKYRRYTFTNRSRTSDATETGISISGGRVTLTVYRSGGMNYYYANGIYLCKSRSINAYGTSPLNGIGMNFCGATGIVIEDITVKELFTTGISDAITTVGASVRYCDKDGGTEGTASEGLRFTASVNKTSALYRSIVPSGEYDPSNENVKFGMLILPEDLLPKGAALTFDTENVLNTEVTRIESQDSSALTFTVSLLGIPKDQQSRAFVARPYVKEKTENGWAYTYARDTVTRSYVGVANLFYEDTTSALVRARLDSIFDGCEYYAGKNAKTLTFCLFSDFHYKVGMYMSSVADMKTILDRANDANADFIIHAGDFCNDYKGSPELMKAYFENGYDLPAYGVMGNHELETKGNDMALLTTLLTNRAVTWGTEDGTVGDGSIAYYYYETNGFRIICLDTNYSYETSTRSWVHNPTASSGPPSENQYANSLGPDQLRWLESVLTDAANESIPCVVVSHASFSGEWSSSPDASAVQAIFRKANNIRMGTVLMAINGHLHTNRSAVVDGVLYLDMNTTRNGLWRSDGEYHYTNPKHTFEYVTYDDNGTMLGKTQKELGTLSMGSKTWFFADPLSATITVSTSGRITVEGMQTEWIYGVVPENIGSAVTPEVSSGVYDLPLY